MKKRRSMSAFLLAVILLSGCTPNAAPAEESSLRSAESETLATIPAPALVLEPLQFENDLERAIYSFDWQHMSLAKDLVVENMTYYYMVWFADLDLDGKAEILLSSGGGYPLCSGPFLTVIFTVKGNRLELVGTVILAQDETKNGISYGPDSWSESQKQFYEGADSRRIILESAVFRVEPHVYAHCLYAVSLDEYSTTPVLLYCEPDDHYASYGMVRHWYYYNQETGSCEIEDLRNHVWKEDGLAAQGIIPISETEYEQRMEEYLTTLTPAGTLPVSEVLSYSVSLGLYGDAGLDDLAIVVPADANEDQKNELINRGLAKKIYERYRQFQAEIQGP